MESGDSGYSLESIVKDIQAKHSTIEASPEQSDKHAVIVAMNIFEDDNAKARLSLTLGCTCSSDNGEPNVNVTVLTPEQTVHISHQLLGAWIQLYALQDIIDNRKKRDQEKNGG